jgi:hypothetical protein
MNSWSFRRAVLALGVGLGIVTGLARAQIVMPPANGSVPPATAPGAVIMPEPAPAPHPGDQPAQTRIQEHLHRHGLQCFAEINSLGCGSLKSDCQFIFGSCHTFFGQPCLPQSPRDNGILGAQSYGIPGRARGGCGCP